MSRGRLTTWATVALMTVILLWLPVARSGSVASAVPFLIPFFATVAIFAVVAIGLNVQWGYTGIFNFGVVAFFMVGAYTAAIFSKPPASTAYVQYWGGFGDVLSPPFLAAGAWLPFVVGTLMAAVVSAVLALLLALPTLRLRDDYLAITTIGVAEVLRRITIEERWLVNGTRGLTGIPSPLAALVPAEYARVLFLVISVACLLVVYLLVERGIRSPWGRVLRALREDEDATAASGKNVFAFRMQGFVLGAAIIGVGGAMYAYYQSTISPDAFTHFFGTFLVWAMLIVGGSGNNLGAALGAYIVWGFWSVTLQAQAFGMPEFLAARVFFLRDFLIGTLIVVVLLLRPEGLLPEQPRVSRYLSERVRQLGPPTPAEKE
jgi:branched-chain amino acid transport system permease protein